MRVAEKSKLHIPDVHRSTDTQILTIWGKDFKDVRGRKPCYLKIPSRPLILFVAGLIRNDGQAIVHIANTTTHKITDIPAHDSEIGTNIGEPQEGWFERVKSVAGDLLIIEAAYIGRRYTCFIDLENHRFLREEGYVEGPPDGKLHHFLRSALGMLVSIFLPRKMIHEGGKPLAHSLRQSFHLTIRGAELIVVEPTSNIEV